MFFDDCANFKHFATLIEEYYAKKQSKTLSTLESLFDEDNITNSLFLQRFFFDNDEWVSVDNILQMPQFCELFGKYGWNKQQYGMNKAVFINMVQCDSQILKVSKDKEFIRRVQSFSNMIHQPNQVGAEQIKQRGNELFKQQKYSEAIEEYLNALRHNEYDYKITMNLSCAYLAIEDFENALKYANKSISLQPSYSKPYAKAAMVLFAMGKKQKAIAAIDHAMRHQPGNEQYLAQREEWQQTCA